MNTNDLLKALGNPRSGELAYEQFLSERTEPWAKLDRLDALSELKSLTDAGKIPVPAARRGTNTHIHTNESFSIFRSPAEAAWQAFVEGVEVIGINDHYTIAGHREFAEACRILGLRATFSMEAVALDENYREQNIRCNDPGNAGRTYLSGKGVVRELPSGSRGRRDLDTMRESLEARNREMVYKLNGLLGDLEPKLKLDFNSVLALTPRGNTTERHVCQALAELIDRSIPDQAQRRAYLTKLVGEVAEKDLAGDAAYQNMLRARLVKAGKPAYVQESPEAFVSWERMIAMFREMGAIPSYPVLGNPVTELEEDLDHLFNEIERFGIYAIEVIPHRNDHDRLAAILQKAAERGLPVFNGTEHNTKTPMPLIDKWSASDEFIAQFRQGANVLIGHQLLARYGDMGYITPEGKLAVADRARGLNLFGFVGQLVQKPETLTLLEKLGLQAARHLLVGLHQVVDKNGAWTIRNGAGISADDLAEMKIADGQAEFANEKAAEFLRNWAAENVIV